MGNYAIKVNIKVSICHWNSDADAIYLSQVINLIIWLVYFFCDFATEFNKKARANTKNKRNIFTLSTHRYEMADESVGIQGTTFRLCLFCLTTGKLKMFNSFCYHWIVFAMHNENVLFMDYDMLTDRLRWTSYTF